MLFENNSQVVTPDLVIYNREHQYPEELDEMTEDVAAWYFSENGKRAIISRAKFINRHGETILVDKRNGLELKRPTFWHYGQPGFAYHYLLGFLGAILKKETP